MRSTLAPSGLYLSILCLTLWLTISALGQPQAGAGDEVFFDSVSVDIVNVEVFVTDKKDEPVAGLTAEDFELYVDGDLTSLTNFYAQDSGEATSLNSSVNDRGEFLPEEQIVTKSETEARRLYLMVFVDNLNTRSVNRKRTFKHLRKFLSESLDPEDLVALVSLDASLNFRTDFVQDRDLLNQALDEIEKVGSPDAAIAGERQRIFNDIQTDLVPSAEQALLSRIRVTAQSKYRSGKVAAKALCLVVDSMAGIPGRKAILQVGDGVPNNPGEDMYLAWSNRFGSSLGPYESAIGSFGLMKEFQELARKANTAQVTFYNLDAVSDYRSFGRSSAYAGGVENYLTTNVLETAESNGRAPLEFTAVDTGGRRVQSTGRIGQHLAKIGNDFSSFYSLGFRAPEGDSKNRHQIKVKVVGKGLKVRHRQDYEDKDADRKSGEALISALLYNAVDTSLGVALDPLPLRLSDSETLVLPVMVKIPISNIGFLPQDQQHNAQLAFFVTVKDEKGGIRPVQKIPFKFGLPSSEIEDARRHTADYELPVLLRPGDQLVAIAVRDEIGGRQSTLRLGLPEV